MDRRGFLRTALATSAGPFLFQNSSMLEREACGSAEYAGGFETVGLYASPPAHPPPKGPRGYYFFKACGYNYLEFCERSEEHTAGLQSQSNLVCRRLLATINI